jgi:hypothetical protein
LSIVGFPAIGYGSTRLAGSDPWPQDCKASMRGCKSVSLAAVHEGWPAHNSAENEQRAPTVTLTESKIFYTDPATGNKTESRDGSRIRVGTIEMIVRANG